jgi:hypothetical protein
VKTEAGPVADCLRAAHAPDSAMAACKDVVAREIVAEDEDAGY